MQREIYFAGSIRGGRDDQALYLSIIEELQKYGSVFTEHVDSDALSTHGEPSNTDEFIYQRDMEWLGEADVIVAEVTTPSLGVGYEIGRAEAMGKPVVCLYRPSPERSLSAMIAGNRAFRVEEYQTLDDLISFFADYFTR